MTAVPISVPAVMAMCTDIKGHHDYCLSLMLCISKCGQKVTIDTVAEIELLPAQLVCLSLMIIKMSCWRLIILFGCF